jgi:hypothetical protein
MPDDHSVDILGAKPIAKAAEKVVSGAVDGVGAFLSRICLPAAEEFGLLLRDCVQEWRKKNLLAIAQKAEQNLYADDAASGVHAPPRLISRILGEGSWIEDAEVQAMWAGLLSSSCTEEGDDDGNLLFVNLLSGLTKLQATILNHACEKVEKSCRHGFIIAGYLMVPAETLFELTNTRDLQRLDRELRHLHSLGLLLDSGFDPRSRVGFAWAGITPTVLALHMYVRCRGKRTSPIEYFGLPVPETDTK